MHAAPLIAILIVAVVTAARPASAQPRCPALPEPAVRLAFAPSTPAVDSIAMAELRRMSREGVSEHKHTLGLYKAELRSAMRLEYAIADDGRTACVGLRAINLDIQLADRRIYVARELDRGGCRHGVTLAHEQQHARIDDTVFARELPKLKQALARAATDIGVAGPVPSRGIAAHRDDIGERIERAFRHEVDRINETRRREQSALDTPESYRREAARCPDGMK
jgi:hypothetical protein